MKWILTNNVFFKQTMFTKFTSHFISGSIAETLEHQHFVLIVVGDPVQILARDGELSITCIDGYVMTIIKWLLKHTKFSINSWVVTI